MGNSFLKIPTIEIGTTDKVWKRKSTVQKGGLYKNL